MGKRSVTNFWKILGPGFTTGASDDDPSGIATYSQAGATTGTSLLWMAPFSLPLMALVQEMCARIGLATGRGLAANIRLHMPKLVLGLSTVSLMIANTINIGADLGAMAEAVRIFIPISFEALVVFFAVFSLIVQIIIPYRIYVRYLKWLGLVLLSYVATVLFVDVDLNQVALNTLIPRIEFGSNSLILICAILGTTISPYLFFWQTTQEVEDEVNEGKASIEKRVSAATPARFRKMRLDVWFGMFFSNLIMYFIILTTGTVLYPTGVEITTASQAAEALRPLLGPFAGLFFAIGIIGTGLLAVPVLAGSATYAFTEALKLKPANGKLNKSSIVFYLILSASICTGMLLNFAGIDPMHALLYAAVVNGLVAPIMIYSIVKISSNGRIMGKWVNGPLTKVLGWMLTAIMFLVALGSVVFIVI